MNARQWSEVFALEQALDAVIDQASELEDAARAVQSAWRKGYGLGPAFDRLESALARLDAAQAEPKPERQTGGNATLSRDRATWVQIHG